MAKIKGMKGSMNRRSETVCLKEQYLTTHGWLVGWSLTPASAQKGYLAPL